MLSRRHIRIKVLQALYAYFRDENPDMTISLRALNRSLERIYELYLYDMATFKELHRAAVEQIELAGKKHIQTTEDSNPRLAFVDNKVLKLIVENTQLNNLLEDKHVSWAEYREQFKKIFRKFREEDQEYFNYMKTAPHDFKEDKKLLKYLYAAYICENEFLHQHYEDEYIHWADDLDAAQMMTTKTIKTMNDKSDNSHPLVKLFKDKEDQDFGGQLFRKVVANSSNYEKLISDKTRNWETDRIAVVDILLMKMALAELTEFPEIPIKVTLNEYIELAKQYSTPRSGNFINGVLDKLVIDLKEKEKIVKIGRGLL